MISRQVQLNYKQFSLNFFSNKLRLETMDVNYTIIFLEKIASIREI